MYDENDSSQHTGSISPFEEPSDAPELRDERSENLYRRSDAFWTPVVSVPDPDKPPVRSASYWEHPEVLDDVALMTVESRSPWQRFLQGLGSGTAKKIALAVILLCIAAFITHSALLQVHEIVVVGNETIPTEDIIRLSGIQMGQSTWGLDDEAVMHRIQGNRYLRCTLVDVEMDKVTIHVKERKPAAYIETAGIQLIVDNRGYLLEKIYESGADMTGLVHVQGMEVRHHTVGQPLMLDNEKQLAIYQQIIIELAAMGHPDLMTELDMGDMDSIYLTLADGFSIRMGNEDQLHQKLRAMLITRDKLIEMGHAGGVINVSDPGRPTYLPGENAP